MAAESLRRVGAIVALAVLVLTFIAVPIGDSVVRADGASGGHPITPPPPDSGQCSIEPAPEPDPLFETVLLVSGLSYMVL